MLGLDPAEALRAVAGTVGADAQENVNVFLARSPEHLDPKAMGYRVELGGDGPIFVRTW